MNRGRLALGLLMLAAAIPGLARGQTLEVVPERDSAWVGDVIPLAVRWRPHEQDRLRGNGLEPPDPLPEGFRVLRMEPLVRQKDGTWRGKVFVAFYRVGTQVVPPFILNFQRGAAILRGVLPGDPFQVEIVPTLGGGYPSLRDIKEPPPPVRRPWLPTLLAALGLAGLGVWLARRRRRAPEPVAPAAPPPPPDPYERSLARLAEIELEQWTDRDQVDRHYQAVTDVLRDYLQAARSVPARERTTAELLGTLPPELRANGHGDRTSRLLGEADMVKFARLRPDESAAVSFLGEARDLLETWHELEPAGGGNGHAAG